MKLSALLLLCTITFNLLADDPLARPRKVKGVTVYVMSEPVSKYQIVGEVSTVGWQALVALGSDNSTDAMNIYTLCETLVDMGNRKIRKGHIQSYDAIITDNGDNGTLIKFTD
ncbi:MAG: hypothetical protein MRY83_22845 [Flavobacteriales bacterium]|nr:hypothetical protein [Flavobacteriales bacterium]